MAKTYAKCNNCCREYRCMVARDLIYCAYCGKEGALKIMSDEDKKEPLLTIELEDETSVPKVFYKGKELTAKTSINFEWITQGAHPGIGGLDFKVAHYDKDIKSVRVIGRKTGEFM